MIRNNSMITRFKIVFTCGLFFALAACYRPPSGGLANSDTSKIVESVGNGVSVVCTFLEGVTSNATVINACVTAEELSEIASFIATRFRRSVPLSKCEWITPEVCASKTEIGEAILFVANANAMRFRVDGGAK